LRLKDLKVFSSILTTIDIFSSPLLFAADKASRLLLKKQLNEKNVNYLIIYTIRGKFQPLPRRAAKKLDFPA
jgi:hypothetical protein